MTTQYVRSVCAWCGRLGDEIAMTGGPPTEADLKLLSNRVCVDCLHGPKLTPAEHQAKRIATRSAARAATRAGRCCAVCGAAIESKRSTKRTCSDRCRQRLSRTVAGSTPMSASSGNSIRRAGGSTSSA
jgi:hypothetical protein